MLPNVASYYFAVLCSFRDSLAANLTFTTALFVLKLLLNDDTTQLQGGSHFVFSGSEEHLEDGGGGVGEHHATSQMKSREYANKREK